MAVNVWPWDPTWVAPDSQICSVEQAPELYGENRSCRDSFGSPEAIFHADCRAWCLETNLQYHLHSTFFFDTPLVMTFFSAPQESFMKLLFSLPQPSDSGALILE